MSKTITINGHPFTPAIPLDEAKPPKEAGVYIYLIRTCENGGRLTIRYIGSSNNLRKRVNYQHEAAQKIFNNEIQRDPEKLYVSWHGIDDKSPKEAITAAQNLEQELIKNYVGKVLNVHFNEKRED
jgi:hypothetical protein